MNSTVQISYIGYNSLRHAGRREAAGNTKAALSARPAIRGQGGAAAYRGGGEAGAGTAGVPQPGRQGAGTHYPELRPFRSGAQHGYSPAAAGARA